MESQGNQDGLNPGSSNRLPGKVGEAILQEILRLSMDAIIYIDENQQILIFNIGAEHLFGHRAQEVIGKSMEVLLPEDLRKFHREHIAYFAGGTKNTRSMNRRSPVFGLRKNGEKFPAKASISKVEVDGRRIFTVFMREVTV